MLALHLHCLLHIAMGTVRFICDYHSLMMGNDINWNAPLQEIINVIQVKDSKLGYIYSENSMVI